MRVFFLLSLLVGLVSAASDVVELTGTLNPTAGARDALSGC